MAAAVVEEEDTEVAAALEEAVVSEVVKEAVEALEVVVDMEVNREATVGIMEAVTRVAVDMEDTEVAILVAEDMVDMGAVSVRHKPPALHQQEVMDDRFINEIELLSFVFVNKNVKCKENKCMFATNFYRITHLVKFLFTWI